VKPTELATPALPVVVEEVGAALVDVLDDRDRLDSEVPELVEPEVIIEVDSEDVPVEESDSVLVPEMKVTSLLETDAAEIELNEVSLALVLEVEEEVENTVTIPEPELVVPLAVANAVDEAGEEPDVKPARKSGE